MEFLKKHYEKIALSVVLLVVAVAAFWLTQTVSDVRQTLADQLNQRVGGRKKVLKSVDLTNEMASLNLLSEPARLTLAGDHNVFNPVRWIRGNAGEIRPDPRQDLANTLKVAAISPLNLIITYLGPTGIGDPYRYQFSITREYEKLASRQRPLTTSLTEGTKNDLFLLREIRGPKDTATEVSVELLEGGELITLVKDKLYLRVMGYRADLRFDNKDFPGRRADDTLQLGGVGYKVVAISKDEIVVSAPNGTRTTIGVSSAP